MAAPIIGTLLESEPTLVHGDFYPANVLLADGAVIPVDWEWAGVGAGELDLAALVDGWSAGTVDACLGDYRQARWSPGGDHGHHERLAAARLFLAARWLGGHRLEQGDRMVEHQMCHVRLGLAALDGPGAPVRAREGGPG
jgi:thiamine kinase-like enzyme